jgi:hypothetical protein
LEIGQGDYTGSAWASSSRPSAKARASPLSIIAHAITLVRAHVGQTVENNRPFDGSHQQAIAFSTICRREDDHPAGSTAQNRIPSSEDM